MNFFTTLGLAFTSLTERPSRTILTSLGIIIGVAAVFAMLAIGEAVRQQVLEQANSTSTRTISARHAVPASLQRGTWQTFACLTERRS
jgi:putative ABC transport system permease protein